MRALHKFNPVRLAYIRDEACRHSIEDPKGFGRWKASPCSTWAAAEACSASLARLGAVVTGSIRPPPISPSRSGMRRGRAYPSATGARRSSPSSRVASAFDVVLAMEVVEHVTDVPAS